MITTGFVASVFAIIGSAMDVVASGVYNEVYFQVPIDTATYPCLVYQSQDYGGNVINTIGNDGWEGQITLRSIAKSKAQSESYLSTFLDQFIDQLIVNPVTNSGTYRVQIKPYKPFTFPVERLSDGVYYTTGVIVICNISPEL